MKIRLASRQRSSRSLAALVALLALTLVPVAGQSATDPDVDPAEPIELTIEETLGDVLITSAEAYLQESAEGLTYLRVDYEVLNLSDETLTSHRFTLDLQGIEATVSAGGLLEPGEQETLSFIFVGKDVNGIDSSAPGGSVQLAGSSNSDNTRDCRLAKTRGQCDAIAASMQSMCNGKKVSQGCSAGAMVCEYSCFVDFRGDSCCSWDPDCKCIGRPTEITLEEATLEGLMPPDDPLVNPALGEERRLEVRPNYREP